MPRPDLSSSNGSRPGHRTDENGNPGRPFRAGRACGIDKPPRALGGAPIVECGRGATLTPPCIPGEHIRPGVPGVLKDLVVGGER